MAEIEIYTTGLCPFCFRAKNLLNQKGVQFTEHDVSFDAAKRAEMSQRAGGPTSVPQIFVNGDHLSDCDGLYLLDATGKLDTHLGL